MSEFDMSISFPAGKEYKDVSDLINAINTNCDNIFFDRIPIMYTFNHDLNQYEIYTYTNYIKALEYCLKDMYWN